MSIWPNCVSKSVIAHTPHLTTTSLPDLGRFFDSRDFGQNRRNFAHARQDPVSSGKRATARQPARHDKAADAGSQGGLEAALRVFDSHALVWVDPASLHCPQVRIRIGLAASIVAGSQDEIKILEKPRRLWG